MSIVFTVQSEERVLCTSKPLIWEAVQWGWGGVGERGQEIRIRVINNFCSVINQRHSKPLLPRYTPIFMSSALSLLRVSFILNVHFHLELDYFPQCCWSYITCINICIRNLFQNKSCYWFIILNACVLYVCFFIPTFRARAIRKHFEIIIN